MLGLRIIRRDVEKITLPASYASGANLEHAATR